MSTTAWRRTDPRTKRALAFHRDGLLDVFLGLTLLDAWTILQGRPGAVSGGSIVILFPLLLVAKRAITVPRLSSEGPTPLARPWGPKTLSGKTLLALAIAALVLVLAGIGVLSPSEHGKAGAQPWEVVVLAGIACVAAAGVQLGARRFVVYAGLTGIGLVLALHGRTELGRYVTPVLAAGMVAWGAVLLVRFLTIRPRPG